MARINLKILKHIFSLSIIFIIFILLSSKVNFFEIINVIKTINKNLLILSLVLSIVSSVIIGSDRLRYMLHILGCEISFNEAIFIKMGSLPLRMLPSAKINFLSQIVYLKKYKDFAIFSGLHTIALGLMLNIIAQSTFFFTGLIFCIWQAKGERALVPTYIFYIASLSGLVSVICFICLKSKKVQNIILPLIHNINATLYNTFIKLISMYRELNNKKLLNLWLYSIVFQFLELVVCYILSRSLNISIPFYSIMLFVPIIILISNLPITLGGIGVREATLFFFFSGYGRSEQILSLGMMYSFSEYIIPVLIGLLFIKSFLYRLV